MIHICDAIMGSGKSSAAITYINEHTDRKYIYITPYLEEADRIKDSCPKLQFFTPLKTNKYHGSKILHTEELVAQGVNITSTHQAFRSYPKELRSLIKEKGYTLIVDESVDVLERVEMSPGDVRLLIEAGYIKREDSGLLKIARDDYCGTAFKEILKIVSSKDIISVVVNDKEIFYWWMLPSDLLQSFDDVFILTYLFKGHSLYQMLKMNNVEFEEIGVMVDKNNTYRFCPYSDRTIPGYVKSLSERIHISDNNKLNRIGDNPTDLSMSWFENNPDKVDTLRKNLTNYFRNIDDSNSVDSRLWSTFADSKHKLRGKGYTNAFVSFNERATNKYRNKTSLAYCVNLFMNVSQKIYFLEHDCDVDEDTFALSTMVQWIWRSAIRDGKDINIYIPSKRMRELLIDWIQNEERKYYESIGDKDNVRI